MALTVTSRKIEKENKHVIEIIAGTFSTTDLTGSLTLQGLKTISHHSFGVYGTPGAAQGLSLNHAPVKGIIVVPSNGFVNVVRTGTASGLAFSLILFGNN